MLLNKLNKVSFSLVGTIVATVIICGISFIPTLYSKLSKYADIGVELVNLMYTFDDLDTLRDTQDNMLSNLVTDEVLNSISLQSNSNRVNFAYFDMEGHTVSPLIFEHRPGYISYYLIVDGERDSTKKGIWYTTNNEGKIDKFLEANYYAF